MPGARKKNRYAFGRQDSYTLGWQCLGHIVSLLDQRSRPGVLYLRRRNQNTPRIPIEELLVLGVVSDHCLRNRSSVDA